MAYYKPTAPEWKLVTNLCANSSISYNLIEFIRKRGCYDYSNPHSNSNPHSKNGLESVRAMFKVLDDLMEEAT